MTAPCLTHMMDASFSSLAMERFLEHGVRDFVAIHDSWIVPAFVPAPTRSKVLEDDREQEWQDKQDRSGPALLRAAIKSAGEEWLRGLGPVYDRLLHYLAGTEFEADVRSWKDQWERRRREARWPQFTALPPEREVLTGPSRTPLKTRF